MAEQEQLPQESVNNNNYNIGINSNNRDDDDDDNIDNIDSSQLLCIKKENLKKSHFYQKKMLPEDILVQVTLRDILNEDDDVIPESKRKLGSVDMIVNAATYLADIKESAAKSSEIHKMLLQTPIYMVCDVSFFFESLKKIALTEEKAVLVLSLPFDKITSTRSISDLGCCIAQQLTVIENKLEKLCIVITYDNETQKISEEDGKESSYILYSNDAKNGASHVLNSMLAGFMSPSNFYYWYAMAHLSNDAIQELFQKEDFEFTTLITKESRASYNKSVGWCRRFLENMIGAS